mmetsp:Transcript_6590/g.27248  ORF Transcript_6590/g.27248 Transcript_6590/m.27248 type:complete len:448 (-) Transcript_6590:5333-6676(-)
MVAAHQRHRDAGEAGTGDEVQRQLALHARDLVDAHHAGQRAREGHGQQHLGARPDAGIVGGARRAADGAHRIAGGALPQEPADEGTGQQRDDEAEVERRRRQLIAQRGGDLVQGRHAGAVGKLGRLDRHAAGRAQPVHQQIAVQPGGKEVEHDGRDDDVAAAPGLQIRRHGRPQHAEARGGQHQQRQHHDGRQLGTQPQRDQGHAHAAQRRLPLAADIEQAGMNGHGHGQTREDEGRRVVQRIAEAARAAKRAIQQHAQCLPGAVADEHDDPAGHKQRDGEVPQRQQADVDPLRELDGLAHATARSSCAAISKPRRRSSHSSMDSSPVMRPAFMTTTRSASARISSSSLLTSSTAQPASRRARSCLWMNSMAPMSTPRVGWPTSSTVGCSPISRARISFCWLPPENLLEPRFSSRGRTSKRSCICFVASRIAAWFMAAPWRYLGRFW